MTDPSTARLPRQAPRWAFLLAGSIALVAVVWGASLFDEIRRERAQRWTLEKYVARIEEDRRLLEEALKAEREVIAAISAGNAEIFGLDPVEDRSGTGRIVWDRKKRTWTLYARELPDLPEGQVFELWSVHGNERVAAGKFVARDGRARHAATLPAGQNTFSRAEVTIEPVIESAEETKVPNGPVVMAGAP